MGVAQSPKKKSTCSPNVSWWQLHSSHVVILDCNDVDILLQTIPATTSVCLIQPRIVLTNEILSL